MDIKTEIAENILTEIGPIQDAESDTRNIQAQFIEEEDVQTVEQYRLSGIDSNPPVGTKHLVIDLGGGWKISHAENDGVEPDSSLEPGETKVYSSLAGIATGALVLKKNGKVSLGNGTIELLSLFNDNLTEVITALKFLRDTITFSNGGGPTGPPTNGTVLTPVITSLETTQTALGLIKI